jgi:hypothetical protein
MVQHKYPGTQVKSTLFTLYFQFIILCVCMLRYCKPVPKIYVPGMLAFSSILRFKKHNIYIPLARALCVNAL